MNRNIEVDVIGREILLYGKGLESLVKNGFLGGLVKSMPGDFVKVKIINSTGNPLLKGFCESLISKGAKPRFYPLGFFRKSERMVAGLRPDLFSQAEGLIIGTWGDLVYVDVEVISGKMVDYSVKIGEETIGIYPKRLDVDEVAKRIQKLLD